jgi:hypothetical protein
MRIKDEVQGVMSKVEGNQQLIDLEKKLHQALVKAIDESRASDGNTSDAYDALLGYLERHNKLLKDAVYPHLCSEIDGMAA